MATRYVIRSLATMEEKDFLSKKECYEWMAKVKHTFQDENMEFELITVSEKTEKI